MINKDNIFQAWFPTSYEIGKYLEKFNQKISIPENARKIILRNYQKTISRSKITKIDNKCPHCNSELKFKLVRGFGEMKEIYVCPNWKPNNSGCPGIIMNKWTYQRNLDRPFRVSKCAGSWMQDLIKELKENNFNYSKSFIYRILKSLELESPSSIDKKMIKKYENRETKIGEGYTISKAESLKQEMETFDLLQTKYPIEDIKYQEWIFYKLIGDSKTYVKRTDFLIIPHENYEGVINIFECKLSEYDCNDEQKLDYITLLSFMYPNNKIEFNYVVNREGGELWEKKHLRILE